MTAVSKPLRKFSGRLVLVGAGKMGSAMLEGWIARGLKPKQITVIEPHPGKT
ncbi:MAG: NAD(P)-binding domain-containing protein, partial [Pseudolabrys sp.]